MLKNTFTSLNICIIFTLAFTILYFWIGHYNIISWDAFGQYIYLPNLFIDGSFQLPLEHYSALNSIYHFSDTLYQFNSINGIAYTRYTCGLALLLLPFFLIGHLFAFLLDYTMDGYTLPYMISAGLGCLFYTISGLLILRKVLLSYFEDKLVALLLILIVLGTNFYAYLVPILPVTHTFCFLFLSLVLLFTQRFHKDTTIINGFGLGISLAILGLIRFPDLLFGIIPVLWGIPKYGGFIRKIRSFLTTQLKPTLAVIIGFGIVISLQFIYWKIVSGDFIINSYSNNVGEGLDWFNPHTFPFLFSFRKGWFIYTPIAILSTIGIVRFLFKSWNQKVLVFSFLLFLYVVSSWTNWWYAFSFSQRAMIDIYPIVAIGIGSLLTISKIKYWVLSALILCIPFNLFQIWQFKNGIISGSQMTQPYYFSVFGQTSPPTPIQKSLLRKDYTDFKFTPFETILHTPPIKIWNTKLDNGNLNEDNYYTESIFLDLSPFYNRDSLFMIKTSWKYTPGSFTQLDKIIPNFSVYYKGQSYGWTGLQIGDQGFEIDTVNDCINAIYILPYFRTLNDSVRVQVWRQGQNNIHFISVKIKMFQILGKKK